MPLILGSVFVLRGLRDVLEGLKVVPGGAEGSQRQMEGHLHGVLPGAWGTQSVRSQVKRKRVREHVTGALLSTGAPGRGIGFQRLAIVCEFKTKMGVNSTGRENTCSLNHQLAKSTNISKTEESGGDG